MRHKSSAGILGCLLLTVVAGCAAPHGNDPNRASCYYQVVLGRMGGSTGATVTARCDPSPSAFSMALELKYAPPIPFQNEWHTKATTPPDTRIPDSNGLTYSVVNTVCLIGVWRVEAHAKGTNPDGTDMGPISLGYDPRRAELCQ
ncbi:hypothetical protein [Streptomyces sp. TLI_171]|uniref:hypothetical protein n=1 Tax=Streptomyces sp. TLI_171 TaxID=1938859 RepID=UPI000C1749A4|nr:hypothetical protein [Streptomyces sp. TLI_171]RKE16939.1 hypothetical protein BX266_0185 [Streptomyces sp. TLI_171]